MDTKVFDQVPPLYSDGKYACFIGFDDNFPSNELEIKIPLTEITNNTHYFIDKKLQYIEKLQNQLNTEKKELKQKLQILNKKS